MRRVSEGEVMRWRCVVASDDVKVADAAPEARQRLTPLYHTSAASDRPNRPAVWTGATFVRSPDVSGRSLGLPRMDRRSAGFREVAVADRGPAERAQRVCNANGGILIRSLMGRHKQAAKQASDPALLDLLHGGRFSSLQT